ncbi:MAG: CHASE2 domain-containing protein, partial [Opitutaceae bacterium]
MPPPSHYSRAIRWRWLLPVVGLVVAFHFLAFGSPALDRAFFDTASRHPVRSAPLPSNSALVLVNDATMELLGREPYTMRWPFPRAAFAGLIAALDRAGAERIIVDYTFFDQSDSAEQDLLLAGVAAASPRVVLASSAEQGPEFWNAAYRKDHPQFFTVPRTGNVSLSVDGDNITRHYVARGSLAAAAFTPPAKSAGGLLHWHGGLQQIEARGV